jgi:two-component system cell cycle response regulator DivK
MKILIVEDNARMRQALKSFLADCATEFIECADGAAACAAYAAQQPDVVLMDIELPGLDGISAARQITAADPAARVIIVTNYDHAGLRDAAQAAGACGYVLKENLLEVRQLLATR